MKQLNIIKLWQTQSKTFKVMSIIALACVLFWSLKGIVFAEELEHSDDLATEGEELVLEEEAIAEAEPTTGEELVAEEEEPAETEIAIEAEAEVKDVLAEEEPETEEEIVIEEEKEEEVEVEV